MDFWKKRFDPDITRPSEFYTLVSHSAFGLDVILIYEAGKEVNVIHSNAKLMMKSGVILSKSSEIPK